MTLGRLAYTKNGVLHILDIESGGVTVIDDGSQQMHSPTWHPEGTFVAYASSVIMAVRLEDMRSRPVSPIDQPAAFPVWHPSGRLMLYDIQGTGIHLHSLETDKIQFLPLGNLSIQAACHPDQQQIAFVGVIDGEKHICTVDLKCLDDQNCPTAVAQLTRAGRYNHAPSYSPDGTRIAFERFLEGGEHWAIMTMNTDGSDLQQITPAGVDAHHPTWGPGGNYLAFERVEKDVHSIHLIYADGSGMRGLTSDGEREPAWWFEG
ncbi:MAG TPA: hypothetical protein PLD47_04675 [Aggregatilineales bacterium]|nr:PD40 domain-containing protein [Anaerolineales bacterium]HRE46998.1 hypothetical protein [Aggregatilineales bacterium]